MPRMNFYITKSNEVPLRRLKDKTLMSGLINYLLDEYFSINGEEIESIGYKVFKESPAAEPKDTPTSKTYKFCKHDAVKGMCKKGCK